MFTNVVSISMGGEGLFYLLLGVLSAALVFLFLGYLRRRMIGIKWWGWIISSLWLLYTLFVVSMAFTLVQESAGRAALAGTAIGNGYSRMAMTAGTLAEFIHALGYNAIPMGNDTALNIPIAVDAGLGELGRNGLLITPKYGPRVRLCKVLTDLPLVKDKSISFGVTEFCEACGKCAELCPSESIINGRRTLRLMTCPAARGSSSDRSR